jgi:hypothetical protein
MFERQRAPRHACVLAVSIASSVLAVSCASSPDRTGFAPEDASVHGDGGLVPDGPSFFGDAGAGGMTDSSTFDVEPSPLQVLMVPAGQTMPTVAFQATLGGAPVKCAWAIDRGDLATIDMGPSSQGVLHPTGTTGGLVRVLAGLNGQTVVRKVLIQLTSQQNGANPSAPGEASQIPTTSAQLGAGGGVGGVGGEGLGGAVTDPATLMALQNPTGNGQAQALTLLYPYDQTVFPRGLLAPLLQWDWVFGDADAIRIQLRTSSGSFSWTGTFARPAILQQTSGPFVRHPIPQDIWTMATNSAGGPTSGSVPDRLTMSLVVAHAGKAYGPVTETWTIAPARLEGTIYYNSYGTALVQNSATDGLDFYQKQYGAGTLAIAPGATAPTLVAGISSVNPAGDGTGCRVCHTVSGDGKTLLTQASDVGAKSYATTEYINLLGDTTGGAGTPLATTNLTYPALTKDGSLLFSGAGGVLNTDGASRLYWMPSGTPVASVTGLGSGLQAALPSFSPDGKHVAFNFWSGALLKGANWLRGDQISLGLLDFDGFATFSNPRILYTPNSIGPAVAFSSFLPTSTALVFELRISSPATSVGYTTSPITGELWWVDLASGNAHRLDMLDGYTAAGTTYLPNNSNATGGGTHTSLGDTQLNYEPTVNPIASGGYAWVVFTSRRMYGSVAQIDPYASDPRHYAWRDQVTTKKLWVAAIDLSAPPGTDASHPAFYLPGQELHAGNARGYWTVEPCRGDGLSCMAGDQCCGGYCEPGADGGLVCGNAPPTANCSQAQERCTQSADCCDPTNTCINGFCSTIAPR